MIKYKYNRNLSELEFKSNFYYGKYKVQSPIIAYKKIKCTYQDKNHYFAIAELEIPISSIIIKPLILYPTDYFFINKHIGKLRTNKAIVKNIYSLSNNILNLSNTIYYSLYDNNYTYAIGDEKIPRNFFDDNVYTQCASGIHFFLTKHEAEKYN